MKKYIVFAYCDYYPCGGLGDMQGSFDTIKEARESVKGSYYDNIDIIDRDTWKDIDEDT